MRAFLSYCPGQQPARKPTIKPTAFPTRGDAKTAKFSAELVRALVGCPFPHTVMILTKCPFFFFLQTLVGVDKTSFEASDAAATAFKEAVVLTMSGDLSSDDVTKLSVEDLTTRRRLQSSASAVVASFTVDAQSVYSANQLFAELSSAVTSGAFNTVLFDRATAAGATALAGSTARSISRTSESSEPELSVGGIVGIATGAAALLVILIGLAYWVRVGNARSRTGITY